MSNNEKERKTKQIRDICKEKRKIKPATSLSVSPLLPICRTFKKKTPFLSHRTYLTVKENLPRSRTKPTYPSVISSISSCVSERLKFLNKSN